ncbi:unnamed protein product, partial [Brachionus calyciflorus]
MENNFEYDIGFDKQRFDEFLENSKPDPQKKNARCIIGCRWADSFEQYIKNYEKIDIKLKGNIARYYPGNKRSDANFFNGNASCKYPGCQVKYLFSVSAKPQNDNTAFIPIKVIRKNPHLHQTNKDDRPLQIRGDERTETAKDVILNFGGSASAYINNLAANGLENLPTEQVIRNAVCEYNRKDLPSTCWLTNLLYSADQADQTFQSKKKIGGLNGYVQHIEIHKDFSLTLHHENQLKLIKSIPPDRRILHIDASGGLVKIKKDHHDYGQILNYCMILKDSSRLAYPEYALINETSTSRHDAYQIGSMFRLVKNNYLKVTKEKSLKFRLIMCDMSWPTIHAVLEIFNRDESVEEYSMRVFKISKHQIDPNDSDLTLIGSCNSHTMHRVTRMLKRKLIFNDRDQRRFGILCFSLLVNCLDLASFDIIFKAMCVVFLSSSLNSRIEEAIKFLDELIQERPILSEKTENIIKAYTYLQSSIKYQNQNNGDDSESNVDDEDGDFEESSEQISDEIFCENKSDKKRATIKDSSPFTHHFNKIKIETINNLDQSNLPNVFYNKNFIDLLSENFLPYAFIWSGFVFRNLVTEETITRLTNGTIEKYFATRKKLVKNCKEPAFYVNRTIRDAFGQALRSKNVLDVLDDCTSDEESICSDQEDRFRAVDKWGKKPSKKNKKTQGFYNKPHALKINIENMSHVPETNICQQDVTVVKLEEIYETQLDQDYFEGDFSDELDPPDKRVKLDNVDNLVPKNYNLRDIKVKKIILKSDIIKSLLENQKINDD